MASGMPLVTETIFASRWVSSRLMKRRIGHARTWSRLSESGNSRTTCRHASTAMTSSTTTTTASSPTTSAALSRPTQTPVVSSLTTPLAAKVAPDSALVALAARLGHAGLPLELVRQAVTDPSYTQMLFNTAQNGLHASSENIFRQAPHNAPLASLGNALLGLYVSEVLHLKFPHAPASVVKKLVSACTGTTALAALGRAWGLGHVLSWQRGSPRDLIQAERKGQGQFGTGLDTRRETAGFYEDVTADATRAIFATIYIHYASAGSTSDGTHASATAVLRSFIHAQLIAKDSVRLENHINPPSPRRLLDAILRKYHRGPATMRILKETGRGSNQALFVVGVFDGPARPEQLPPAQKDQVDLWSRPNASGEKLGEDFGGSIKMAEHRAARNAIIRLWFAEQADAMLPSETIVQPDIEFAPTAPGETEALQ